MNQQNIPILTYISSVHRIMKWALDHPDFGINPDVGIHLMVFQNRGFTVFILKTNLMNVQE